jgi:hypothetical protein
MVLWKISWLRSISSTCAWRVTARKGTKPSARGADQLRDRHRSVAVAIARQLRRCRRRRADRRRFSRRCSRRVAGQVLVAEHEVDVDRILTRIDREAGRRGAILEDLVRLVRVVAFVDVQIEERDRVVRSVADRDVIGGVVAAQQQASDRRGQRRVGVQAHAQRLAAADRTQRAGVVQRAAETLRARAARHHQQAHCRQNLTPPRGRHPLSAITAAPV